MKSGRTVSKKLLIIGAIIVVLVITFPLWLPVAIAISLAFKGIT